MQPDDTALVQPSLSPERKMIHEVERIVGAQSFDCWFRDKTSIAVAGSQVTIGVENKFLLAWMQRQFHAAVTEAARGALGDAVGVRFQLAPAAEKGSLGRPAGPDLPLQAAPRRAARDSSPRQDASHDRVAKRPKTQPPALGPQLAERPHHNAIKPVEAKPAGANRPVGARSQASSAPGGRHFADLNDFVKGTCNELALTAVLHVCEQPGVRYNPLVLYGGVGTGKTHLLEATYRRLRARHPSLNVMFLSAESFANFFTQALRDHTLPSFRQRFRTVDVLMVDDVDFLDGKRVIQEEFLHTIRHLESHQRQIVLSADRHPRLLTRLSDELVTRFIAGIVCRIESPDPATRQAIVTRKAAHLAARVDGDALRFVAQRFKTSIREIEGALNSLETYGLMSGETVTLAIADRVLADLERDCVRAVRVADVEQTICRLFAIDPGDLRSPRRNRSLSRPRMLAMFLARKLTQAAYREIGEHFGGRNHSTVVSAEKRVRQMIDSDTTLRVAAQDWKLGDLISSLEQQLLTG